MKAILTALITCITAAHATDENDDYLNFIIQIQNDANQTTHKLDDITPNGNGTALRGVETSSTFQLWTINRETAQEFLLDEQIVSSYHPRAEITITTADPYKPIPRTRVDQPFHVRYKVNGLIPGNSKNTPEAAKSVTLQHVVTSYGNPAGGGSNALEGLVGGSTGALGGNTDQLFSVIQPEVEITKNGTRNETRFTAIQAPDLTTASGEETFTIFAKPDYGVEENSILANAKVQIWPIAQGSISGFQPGQSYAKLPDLKVDLLELYPSSTTYVRAYLGEPTESPSSPIIINTSYVIIDDVKTIDRDFTITGLDKFLTETGSYTLEIIHITPFGADVLNQVSGLVKKNSIKVIGNLTGSE